MRIALFGDSFTNNTDGDTRHAIDRRRQAWFAQPESRLP